MTAATQITLAALPDSVRVDGDEDLDAAWTAWREYVAERMPSAEVSCEQSSGTDQIECVDDDGGDAAHGVRGALEGLWEQFCSDGWPGYGDAANA